MGFLSSSIPALKERIYAHRVCIYYSIGFTTTNTGPLGRRSNFQNNLFLPHSFLSALAGLASIYTTQPVLSSRQSMVLIQTPKPFLVALLSFEHSTSQCQRSRCHGEQQTDPPLGFRPCPNTVLPRKERREFRHKEYHVRTSLSLVCGPIQRDLKSRYPGCKGRVTTF